MFGINVRHVVQGHVKELFNKEQELSEQRMKICRQCPLFTDSMGGICDSKKCYNTKTKQMAYAPGDDVICGCQCRLEAKSRIKGAKCVLDKWPSVNK